MVKPLSELNRLRTSRKSTLQLLPLLFALSLLVFACGSGPDKSRTGSSSAQAGGDLRGFVLRELAKKNPRIDSVAVLDLRTPFPGGKYVLIGWGMPRHGRFEGRFDDELFGVFELDPGLTRILRTYDIIESEAWRDHVWHISDIRRDSVVVLRTGLTYGDEAPKRKAYSRQVATAK